MTRARDAPGGELVSGRWILAWRSASSRWREASARVQGVRVLERRRGQPRSGAVERHAQELANMAVAALTRVRIYFPLSTNLPATAERIQVLAPNRR